MTKAPATRSLPRRQFFARAFAALAGGAWLARANRAEAATQGSDEPFIGEIKMFAGTFAPRGWAFCNGQLLPINQNQALFSILGTQYGGNGISTFALPNLQGRVPIHFGQGTGLTNRNIGEAGGEETHVLSIAEMPAHTHIARGNSTAGTSASPVGLVPARNATQTSQYAANADSDMAAGAVTTVGGSQAHENMQPSLTIGFIIALVGLFPSQ